MADITTELTTIATDIYGRNVKAAIHDALEKINTEMESLEPGGGGEAQMIGCPDDIERVVMATDVGNPVPTIGWDCVQDNSDGDWTFDELSIVAAASGLLVCVAFHRKEAGIDGYGWTRVATSPGIDPTNRNQRITVWTKPVTAGTYSAKVTQTTSGQMTMKLMVLYGAQELTVSDSCIINPLPYTPPAKIGKRRLYVLSSAYAASWIAPYAILTTVPSTLDLQRMEELRFSVFYDYQPEIQAVPSFDYYTTPYEDNINLLVLDVTEV